MGSWYCKWGDGDERTKLRWSKRKLVLDRGSQYLSRDASSSSPSLELCTLAASLTMDYPRAYNNPITPSIPRPPEENAKYSPGADVRAPPQS